MPASRLRLDPEPQAPAAARVWVAGALAGWSDRASDVAALLVSEVVTNAVLHARTALELRLQVDGRTARVDVADRSPSMPVRKAYGAEASTGRGLRLLDAMASRWGVEVVGQGKRVWFEVADRPGAAASATPSDPASWPDLGDPLPVEASPEPPDPAGLVTVRILGMPTAVYLDAEEHNDALVRELALVAEEMPSAEVPRRLGEMAAEFRARFGAASSGYRRQVQAAADAGAPTVDLEVQVPRANWQFLLRLVDQLDEADRWCEGGDLLTLASSPAQRRFRSWYAEQVGRQMRGGEPTPWPVGWTHEGPAGA